nr:MAG TPA: hypothetical protein [Caudoviricetes sp.]
MSNARVETARILATPLFLLSKDRRTRLTSRKQDVVREL